MFIDLQTHTRCCTWHAIIINVFMLLNVYHKGFCWWMSYIFIAMQTRMRIFLIYVNWT